MSNLESLKTLLNGPAHSEQCHAREYCGEPGDVHTNAHWWLGIDQLNTVLTLISIAEAGQRIIDNETRLVNQVAILSSLNAKRQAEYDLATALAELES